MSFLTKNLSNMKTKLLFILLLFVSVFVTGCEEEDARESCFDLGCTWEEPVGEDGFCQC
jgi:hypothetical protein